MVVAGLVLAKNTLSLGTNPPTQIQEVCQPHLSKTNSHLHLTKRKQPKQSIHADRSQEIQRPKRTPTRHSEAKDFSVWRQTWFIMAPKTGSKNLVERWWPERDLDCTRNKLGRTERKSMSALMLLVRGNSACKASAGSGKILCGTAGTIARKLLHLVVPQASK